MNDYTPTTEEIRRALRAVASPTAEEFDRWLAAHDDEVRSGLVAEEPEWEYGISSGHGSVNYVGTRESVDARVRSFEKAGAPLRDVEQIFRRRKVGLWAPVKQEGAET